MDDRHNGPLDRVHPYLIELLFHQGVVPDGNGNELSEDVLADAIGLALSLSEVDDQFFFMSRIMTEQEVAVQGLQHPDVQNMDLHIPLTAAERVEVLRQAAEPDAEDERAPRNVGTCIICLEPGQLTVPMPCNCAFCFPCLREAIRVGLRSEQDFPPQCCSPFLEPTIRLVNRPGLVHLFRQLGAEVAVPAADRLYCYRGECATFIPR
ncbi:hypothetical protein G7Z17_g13665 [Cylindrodendrum hubeiense]|uniref:IBR domain-containing protein n=1 Tax=Cylindrodendrum hubeiense TaxID=595255 RepID=A0A9P5GT58_9HYPO|nr:hypothetical protein G7Z17_g13665 [Cylindrodendrum hubeiense]